MELKRMDATRLITDIKDNNIDAVQSALIQEPSLVSKETLFCAAQKGNLEILKFLVEYSRISLNEYDDDHRNVLHYGAESGGDSTRSCNMDTGRMADCK